jgi:hypothetical protein
VAEGDGGGVGGGPLRTLLPEIVDQTLFQLLDAIDNDRIPLLWRGEDGTQAPLRDVGQWEMAGWLMGGDWPTRYSKERFHNYFDGLTLDQEDA